MCNNVKGVGKWKRYDVYILTKTFLIMLFNIVDIWKYSLLFLRLPTAPPWLLRLNLPTRLKILWGQIFPFKLAVINNFVLLQMLSFSSLTSGQTWSMGFVCAPAAPSPAAQASSIKYGADLRLNSYYHRCSSFLVNSLYVLELSQLGLSFAPAAFVGLWYLFWVLAKNRLWGIFHSISTDVEFN